jgi:hypothetical protein
MLVLKEFKMDENAEDFLYIKAREEGILAFLLSLAGIDTITELKCNTKNLLYRASSVRKGQLNVYIPNQAVTAVMAGFFKPFQLLIVAAVFLLGGVFGMSESIALTIVGLVIAGICVLFYVLNKEILFSVQNGGDNFVVNIVVKRSVIEGVKIEFEEFQKAAALLNEKIRKSREIAS